ncbi:hypothetical protein Q5530_36880 [Saccharothrix sp. BKS2]|uniref:hypothetical protein n=1 Tax=Saccharothrix sp. BKS2 TaxID=3064400 RepID=UPI0039E9C17A
MSRNAYDEALLIQIINGTDTALQNMGTVNQQVTLIAGQLGMANQSTAGQKLTYALTDWGHGFNRVVNSLRALNDNVIRMRDELRTAAVEAEAAAGAGTGS